MRYQIYPTQIPFATIYCTMTTNSFDSHEFDSVCYSERKRIKQLSLDEQYQQHIVYNGRTYFYDPDYDCFYASRPWSELSYWDRYGWLYVTAVLAVICYFVSV